MYLPAGELFLVVFRVPTRALARLFCPSFATILANLGGAHHGCCSPVPSQCRRVDESRQCGSPSRCGTRGHSRNLGMCFFLLSRQRGRLSAPRWETLLCRYFARETTMSTSGHITITRGRNGPSTRLPRVMLNTSIGRHVSSRVCASFADLGTVGQSLLSTLMELDVQIQGLLLGCAVVILCCKSQLFSTQSLVCKPYHDSQRLVRCLRVGKSLVRAARRIGRRRVKWPRRRQRYPRMARRSVYRWRMILSWWLCWLAKLSCGSLRPVGRTPKQQCEDPSRTCGEGVNLTQN